MMKKTFLSFLWALFVGAFVSAAAIPEAGCADPAADLELIQKIDSKFRSSNRYIDAQTLQEAALTSIPGPFLSQLAEMKTADLIKILETSAFDAQATLLVNKGMAENLLKIQQIARRLKFFASSMPRPGEVIFGLRQSNIDQRVAHLPEPTEQNRKAHEFDNGRFEIRQAFKISITENDFYALKIAALWWAEGKHETTVTVSEAFARSKEELPFITVMGQDIALEMLEQFRFSEADIQAFKNHSSLRQIPDGFWDYLRTWKYTGTVLMPEVGTPIAPNTPAMVFTSNPVDTALIEAPLLAMIEDFSRAGTYAARAVLAAGPNKAIIEGGSRRGSGSIIRAAAAYLAGFSGTSNMKAARLFGIPLAGSAENHSTVGQASDELEAHALTLKHFPREESFLLTDTYNDLEKGVKLAIRAGGMDLKGVRIDSPIPGKSIQETVELVKKWMVESGVEPRILYSDDLDEYKLNSLRRSKTPFEFALIGGRLKNGPSLGFVLKTTFIQDDANGISRQVMKMPSADKASLPGFHQVFRVTGKDGKYERDILGLISEKTFADANPSQVTPLLQAGMVRGKISFKPRPLSEQRKIVAEMLRKLPANVANTNVRNGAYTVTLSEELKKLRQETIARLMPAKTPRVGVFPLSGDPIHEGHVELVKKMKARYMLDEVHVVLTADNSIRGKKHRLSTAVRVAMAEKKFAGVEGVKIHDNEANAQKPTVVQDTLETISTALPRNAEIFVMGGSDLLSKKFSLFKNAPSLARKYNWIFAERRGQTSSQDSIQKPADLPQALISDHKALDDQGRILRTKDGKVMELGSYLELPDVSSTKIRRFYDHQPYSFIVHVTDAQTAFLKRSGIPGEKETLDGSLAVDGTEHTVKYIEAATKAAYFSGIARISISGDAHLDIEVKDETQNGEFHGPYAFPPHAMKYGQGPEGNQLIEEIENIIPPEKMILVPHHEEVTDPADGKVKLKLVPFDLKSIADKFGDLRTVIRFDKNGPGSYNVFRNPRFSEYLQAVDPEHLLPHFHFGWCTDFCDKAVVLEELERGYHAIIVIDAMAGVIPQGTKAALLEMVQKGAKFMTLREYLTLVRQWTKDSARWDRVLNDLALWEKQSPTKEKVMQELTRAKWDVAVPACSILLNLD